MDFNFEKLDRYQTYEYFKDNNNCIIFITENSNKLLEEKRDYRKCINFNFWNIGDVENLFYSFIEKCRTIIIYIKLKQLILNKINI